MSLNHPMPDEEISFDHDRSKNSKFDLNKIEENALESSDLRITLGV